LNNLLTQVNVSGSQFPRWSEMDPDELALSQTKNVNSFSHYVYDAYGWTPWWYAVLLILQYGKISIFVYVANLRTTSLVYLVSDTHKTGRVVIPQCLGISKSLHCRISFNDLVL